VGTELGTDYEPLGQYRHGQNTVQDRRRGETIYWPPRPAEVPSLMDEFVEWTRRRTDGDTSPYLVNALAHLNFVAIHPFSDGNGRVGRLLCSLLMMREGYKAQAFWSLEQYFGVHATEYGQVLAEVLGPRWAPERVVATVWIEWYLRAVATQVTDAESRFRRSIAEFAAVVGGIAVAGALPLDTKTAPRTVIPVWLAVTNGSVTRRQLARYVAVADETLSRDLRRLSESGLLTPVGRGRAAMYRPGPTVTGWGDFERLVRIAESGGTEAVTRFLSETGTTPSLFS
jgi:Fic family protein